MGFFFSHRKTRFSKRGGASFLAFFFTKPDFFSRRRGAEKNSTYVTKFVLGGVELSEAFLAHGKSSARKRGPKNFGSKMRIFDVKKRPFFLPGRPMFLVIRVVRE